MMRLRLYGPAQENGRQIHRLPRSYDNGLPPVQLHPRHRAAGATWARLFSATAEDGDPAGDRRSDHPGRHRLQPLLTAIGLCKGIAWIERTEIVLRQHGAPVF